MPPPYAPTHASRAAWRSAGSRGRSTSGRAAWERSRCSPANLIALIVARHSRDLGDVVAHHPLDAARVDTLDVVRDVETGAAAAELRRGSAPPFERLAH